MYIKFFHHSLWRLEDVRAVSKLILIANHFLSTRKNVKVLQHLYLTTITKQNRQQCKMIDGERKSDEIMRKIMEIVRARREDS